MELLPRRTRRSAAAASFPAAFGLVPGDIVSFVGGGGKTSALFATARAIVAGGGRVLSTTTTRLGIDECAATRCRIITEPAAVHAALAEAPHVLLTGAPDPAIGKTGGIEPAVLCALDIAPAIMLIEADGARKRPFKAPAAHEPVVPACTSVLVVVVGIDAIGRPLDDQAVHRAASVARIHQGARVTPRMVAAVLAHRDGGLKARPPGARAIALVNKVDDAPALARARALAQVLRATGAFERIVLAAAQAVDPVREVARG